MTRLLKLSGFLGLAVTMAVGVYQSILLAGGQGVEPWMIGGHAHLGVLSILAIVLGFTIDYYAIAGRLRTIITALYIIGQWMVPGTVWLAAGAGLVFLHPTVLLWGILLVIVMLIMTWQAATSEGTF